MCEINNRLLVNKTANFEIGWSFIEKPESELDVHTLTAYNMDGGFFLYVYNTTIHCVILNMK